MKSKKKFVLAGLLLLAAIITGLTLTGCETEVDPSTPQQEQPDGNTGNSGGGNTQQPGGDSTGDNTGDGNTSGENAGNGGNTGDGGNTSGGGNTGSGGNTSGEGNNGNTSGGGDTDNGEEKPGSGENDADSKPCSHQPGADDGDCTTEVKCTVCGEVVVAAKSHDFSGGWQKDAGNHWHNCKNGGCNKTHMIAAHTGGTATCTEKAVCTVCSTAYGTVDANSHIDENTDHKCDRECGKADIGTHADSAEDNDHLCDYGCGATLEEHTGGTATCVKGKLCETCGHEYSDVDASAHLWGVPEYTLNEGKTECTATVSCQHDNNHKETETVAATLKDGQPAVYIVEFLNPLFSFITEFDMNIEGPGVTAGSWGGTNDGGGLETE